ncbi:MAG: hypothetical protein KF745_09940 [Phycisphaeraceae bacterium]|nr:hypothetical protein [Phycisphaeraceae bacterium]
MTAPGTCVRADDYGQRAEANGRPVQGSTRGSVRFSAELDLAELDGRRRPGMPWIGHGIEISRSELVFLSRKMCYEERLLLVAVHLIDDRPVPLFGSVNGCEYYGEGLYRTSLSLQELPEEDPVRAWIKEMSHKAGN